MRQREIAQTIISQIGVMNLGAMGARKRVALDSVDGRLGGLRFEASLFDRRHCNVMIELTPNDYYRVSVTRLSGTEIASFDDVDFEQLPTIVRNTVEKHFGGKS